MHVYKSDHKHLIIEFPITEMFYINPPRGHISLHILEDCVLNRLEYLKLLYHSRSSEFNGNTEYLLENSAYDRVGHFTLRVLAATSYDLLDSWIKWETLLFKCRLNNILARQLHRLFRSILRELRSLRDRESVVNRTLVDICTYFLKPSLFKHLLLSNHMQECNFFKCKVRFELLPDLLKAREIELDKGYAVIYCFQWKQVLISLFSTYLREETRHIKLQAKYTLNHDVRLNCLYQKIHYQVFQRNCITGQITKENIHTEVKNFPLCMQHLYAKLHSTHRLSHYARLYYTLFLKDCGMQLDEAINYWKVEYTKPHSCTSTCSHDWQSNERKFIYSIKHIYGIEGSRRNYKSPNCKFICGDIPASSYEGGCPFKNFDTNVLRNLLLKSLSEEQVTEFLKTMSSKSPQYVCTNFLKTQHKANDILITSPAEYYTIMISQT